MMPSIQKLYFRPHIIDENKEWLSALHLGVEHHIDANTQFVPNDYDLIFVKSGYVRFYCNTNLKKNNFILIAGRNSLVNVGGVITGASRFSKITTDIESDIVVFDAYHFWDTQRIVEMPELYMSMVKNITKTVNIFTLRSHTVCFYPCLIRFCKMLVSCTDVVYDKNMQYVYGLTQNDLAYISGMHPVTMSRILKKLRNANIIGKLNTCSIDVLDYQKLKDISNFITTV